MLVIIAIIVIIASLLMPALQSAVDSARTTMCLNNQKQCYLGILNYADDYHGKTMVLFVGTGGSQKLWPQFIAGSGMAAGSTRYIEQPEVFGCPCTPLYDSNFSNIDNIGNRGYAMYKGDYPGHTLTSGRSWPSPFPNWLLYTISHIDSPSKLVLLSDSMSNKVSPVAMMGSFRTRGDALSNGRIHLIHNNNAGHIYFDGHAKVLDALELYESTGHQCRYFYEQDESKLNF